MRGGYKDWLESQDLAEGTVSAQLYRCSQVEKYEGDLEEHFAKDRMQSLLRKLAYSAEDERRGKSNPSNLPLGPNVNVRNNLASYRHAADRYRKFLEIMEREEFGHSKISLSEGDVQLEEPSTFSLERDLQTALRANISQLEPGLQVDDGGKERTVETGRIDILAKDKDGMSVIIELKAGTASSKAVAQILGYMGAYMDETSQDVRGILVASDFQAKAELSARPVPNLSLRRYRYRFEFE